MLLAACAAVGGFTHQFGTDQQTARELLSKAIDRLDYALKEAAFAATATTPRVMRGHACNTLGSIDGLSGPGRTIPHPSCPSIPWTDPMGLRAYINEIKVQVERGQGGLDFQDTFLNMQTYISRASDLTKSVINQVSMVFPQLEEARMEMRIVLALLSALKGRETDSLLYGGLLTIQSRLGGR
jgi:hypothetical protein